jgi:hypothetical protein
MFGNDGASVGGPLRSQIDRDEDTEGRGDDDRADHVALPQGR